MPDFEGQSQGGNGELMGGSFDVALSGSSKLVPGLNSRWTSLKQVSSNCLPRSLQTSSALTRESRVGTVEFCGEDYSSRQTVEIVQE